MRDLGERHPERWIPRDTQGQPTRATIVVNGQPGPSLDIPASPAATTPLTADISTLVRSGENTIEVRRAGRAAEASVQVVSDYYVPWARGPEAREAVGTGEARALRLGVTFDKTAVEVGDAVTCAVEIERIGHRGYGMLLAEVGLPPGAEVDRASLDKALAGSHWELSSYEVQPDRVVFYVWPRAGGTTFSFAFRPRFAMRALSGPSVIYDYYNPDAWVTVPPIKLHVRSGG